MAGDVFSKRCGCGAILRQRETCQRCQDARVVRERAELDPRTKAEAPFVSEYRREYLGTWHDMPASQQLPNWTCACGEEHVAMAAGLVCCQRCNRMARIDATGKEVNVSEQYRKIVYGYTAPFAKQATYDPVPGQAIRAQADVEERQIEVLVREAKVELARYGGVDRYDRPISPMLSHGLVLEAFTQAGLMVSITGGNVLSVRKNPFLDGLKGQIEQALGYTGDALARERYGSPAGAPTLSNDLTSHDELTRLRAVVQEARRRVGSWSGNGRDADTDDVLVDEYELLELEELLVVKS